MKVKFTIKKESVFEICIIMSIGLALIIALLSQIQKNESRGIFNLKAFSHDREIYVEWESTGGSSEIQVMASDGSIIEAVELDETVSNYSFVQGQHGNRYEFRVSLKADNAYIGAAAEQNALFLEYDKLPDLPLISVETQNHEMPTYSVLDTPDGCWGLSITDNEYLEATITVTENHKDAIATTGLIRVRGNTSAIAPEKKPYKIVLNESVDLLGREDLYADTEWLLIACDYAFKTVSGMKAAELCGMEWQPQFRTVNLMLNGDWRGCYYLFEGMTVGEHRLNLGETGFLIENDAYWWKEDVYFRTPHQLPQVAYTFKYPYSESVAAGRLDAVYTFMAAYESSLIEGTAEFTQYADMDSLANWLLIHDVMGTLDFAGSNMFLHKYDMQPQSKLKAGPAWDFDTAFQRKDQWTIIHNHEVMHYDRLFQRTDFTETYIQRWNDLSDTIVPDILSYLDAYVQETGAALQESWQLDAAKYKYGAPQVEMALLGAKDWFETRKVWLDEAVYKLAA